MATIFMTVLIALESNPANIHLEEDVLKAPFVCIFRRRLDQDEYIRLSHTSSGDILKTSSRRLDQDQYIPLGQRLSRHP